MPTAAAVTEIETSSKSTAAGKVYMQQITDRDTGLVRWVNLGMHRPLSAIADLLGIGRRHFRSVLKALGMVQDEYDDYSRQMRARLTPWVVESGLGRRIERKKFRDHEPFDVLTELGIEYVRDHLLHAQRVLDTPAAIARDSLAAYEAHRTMSKMQPLDMIMRISWLMSHFPDLRQQDIADIVGSSARFVRKLAADRGKLNRHMDKLGDEWRKKLLPGSLGLRAGPRELREWAERSGSLTSDYRAAA